MDSTVTGNIGTTSGGVDTDQPMQLMGNLIAGNVSATGGFAYSPRRDTRLGSLYFEYDPNDFVAHGVGEQTIFLPRLMR